MRGEYRHHFDGTSQVDEKTMIPNTLFMKHAHMLCGVAHQFLQ